MSGAGPGFDARATGSDAVVQPRGHGLFRATLGDLVGIFLIILVVAGGTRKMFGDGDAATHVATGRFILDHRAIPRTDPFPTTFLGRTWFAHEWLADAGMALVHRWRGWSGVLLGSALIIALAHVLLYRFLVRRGDDALASFGAVVAAAATASSHWLARPHLLTVLFLVILTIVLEEVTRGDRSRAWLALIPPLVLVWTNVHGGFLVAFGTLACYGAGLLLEARPRAGRGDAVRPEAARARALILPLAGASAAAALAVLANPWGWRLPRHLLGFFAVRGAVLRGTMEFAAASFDDRAGVALLVFVLLAIAAALCGGRGALRAGTLAAFAMSATMAFTSIRHVEVLAIFGAIVIADGFSALLRRAAAAGTSADLQALRAREARSGGGLLAACILVFLLLAAAGRLPEAGFDPAQFPVRMVRDLRSAGVRPSGPVLTPDVWGGYLILEWPEAQVYVDGRWDMRGDAFWERYSGIYLARPGWERRLDEDGVTVALLPPDAPLAAAMRGSASWSARLGDATATEFERRPPP